MTEKKRPWTADQYDALSLVCDSWIDSQAGKNLQTADAG
jgi:hypothetical protein